MTRFCPPLGVCTLITNMWLPFQQIRAKVNTKQRADSVSTETPGQNSSSTNHGHCAQWSEKTLGPRPKHVFNTPLTLVRNIDLRSLKSCCTVVTCCCSERPDCLLVVGGGETECVLMGGRGMYSFTNSVCATVQSSINVELQPWEIISNIPLFQMNDLFFKI